MENKFKNTIYVGPDGKSAKPDSRKNSQNNKKGSRGDIKFNPNKKGTLSDGVKRDPSSSLAHENRHLNEYNNGTSGGTRQQREKSAGDVENQYRKSQNLP